MTDAAATQLIDKVNHALGEGTFVLASELQVPRRFTSGSLALDVILGGGWPGNLWSELLGLQSAGKTAVALKTIAANQALDPAFMAMWVAAEHFDTDQATALGVDLDRVIVAPTQEMEVAFALMLEAAESRAVDCIVLDSYPALVPEEEDEKSMSEATVSAGARLFGKFCRKGGKATGRKHDGSERPVFGLVINQYRDKIGGFSRFGTPKTEPGGKAKNYFFYVQLEIARDEYIFEKRPGLKDPVAVGQTIKFHTRKNKGAAPNQTARADFYFRHAPILGFKRGEYDLAGEYFSVGTLFGVIEKRGGWYYYGGQKWQGGDKVVQALRAEPELLQAVGSQVLELAASPQAIDTPGGDE